MAVTNMSIIEKDDLIKKMPRDSLKEELKNPSGNFPLFLVAARLKEVEEMERDVMARQAAQQSSQDAESVAARLAQQAMPQSPMSAVGANPAPQPRPDPQGIMAQQMAGPTQPLPTVMAQTGLRGKYPGQASEISQEIIAAAARARQAKGTPRLYNQARQAGFEKAGRKGAAPASQIPALLGLASALAKTEERAYGGMETLPPFQVESSTMPMSAKGFTAPARSLASRMPKEEDGLSYVSQLLKSMGGSSDDKPTVFAENGFGSQPGMGYDPVLQRDLETFGLSDLQFSRLDPQSQQLIMDSGERYADPSAYERATGIPKVRRDAIRTTLERAQRKNPDSLPFETGIRSYFAPKSEVPRIRAEQDAFQTSIAQLRNVLQPPAPPSPPSGSAQAAPSTDAPSTDAPSVNPPVSEGPVVKKLSSPIDPATVKGDTSAVPEQKPPVKPPVVSPVVPDATKSDDTAPNVNLEATKIGEVDTLSSIGEKYGDLISDPNEQFKPIIEAYTTQLKKVEANEPVPQSMKDMKDRYQNRLDSLEKSPLPFMTAAAAVIKGNQPILVAMTNAMIGYTAGDEKVKNQGLKIMGEMVDLDVNIKTLEAKQQESEMKARNAMLGAREAAMKGQRDREAQLLSLATREQQSLRTAAADQAKLEDAAKNRAVQLRIGTFKTQADKDLFDRAFNAYMKENPGASEFEAVGAAMGVIKPKAPNFSKLNYEARVAGKVDDFFNKSKPGGLRALIGRYNKDNPDSGISPTSPSGADVLKVLEAYEDSLPSGPGVREGIFAKARGGASRTGTRPALPPGFTPGG